MLGGRKDDLLSKAKQYMEPAEAGDDGDDDDDDAPKKCCGCLSGGGPKEKREPFTVSFDVTLADFTVRVL